MQFSSNIRKLIRQGSNSLTLLLIAIVLGVAIYSDNYVQTSLKKDLRDDAYKKLAVLGARLGDQLHSDLQLVRGLTYAIKSEPTMTQSQFSKLAAHLFHDQSLLQVVAAAPDLINRMVYPHGPYLSLIGLNYKKHPEFLQAALNAKKAGDVVMAGPMKLRTGTGHGFIARFPIFTNDQDPETFWGIASTVFDAEKLYSAAGLLDPNLALDVAIVGKDALGPHGEQFFGSPDILKNSPVSMPVDLPVGSWQIYAVPKQGWKVPAEMVWQQRTIIFALSLLLIVPISVINFLAGRQKNTLAKLILRERELSDATKRLGLALDTSKIGIFEYDPETGDLFWDQRMKELFGKTGEFGALDYHTWASCLHPEDLVQAQEEFASALEQENRLDSQYRIQLPNGTVKTIRAIGEVSRNEEGRLRVVGVNWDVTSDVLRAEKLEANNQELQIANSKVRHLATHDALTELPNRRALDELYEYQRSKEAGSQDYSVVIAVDLDDFKRVNDELGHAAGDAVLVHVAGIFRKLVRAEDFVARVGGDEFVVVCKNDLDIMAIQEFCEAILNELANPFSFNGVDCRVGASIGVATPSDGADGLDDLQRNADLALYEAKRYGKNNFEFFTEALGTETRKAKSDEMALRRGLRAGELLPFYQPQYDAVGHRLVGMEALARWNHPEHGTLTPNHFLEVADKAFLTHEIDRAILLAVIDDINDWTRKGIEFGRVSVNISTHSLETDDIVQLLRQSDYPKGALSFELLECIFLDDANEAILENIERIKAMGIEIEIDDFGTGYASFVSLLKTSPERLKIDQQFVRPTKNHVECQQIVKSIVEVARSLNVEVVAEGVETIEQAAFMSQLGCDVLQGYAFAKPMPSTDLEKLLPKKLRLVG